MVFNTSAAEIIDLGSSKSIYTPLQKQLIFAGLGLFFSFLIWRHSCEQFVQKSSYWLIFSIILLLLVFVPSIGLSANGARRWISIAGLSFQPSELVKYSLPLFCISHFLKGKKLTLSFFGVVALPLLLILLEPDNRSTAIIVTTLVMLLFLCGIKCRYWLLPLSIFAAVALLAASQLPYVANRLEAYLHPEHDIRGKGHQPYQAKIAVGSGGWLGKGPGESLQKLNYLPEAQNDYIVAIFAEEYGFVGIALLITLYALLIFLGFYIALTAEDRGKMLVAAMISFVIGLQVFLNFGVVSALLPSTGLNLPFFSQGGSSLVVNMMAITLLLKAGEKKEASCQIGLS
jgi:cell division protein FtsW